LEQSVRTAPHDGIIVYRQVGFHDTKKVAVGDTVGPWRSPLDLPSYQSMKVRTQVPESVVNRLTPRRTGSQPAPGSPARVTIQTLPDKVYPAEVTWVDGWARDRNATLSESDVKRQGFSGLQVFNIEVELLESDPERLREGFRATVELPLRTIRDVLVIPRHAVTLRGGEATVEVEHGGSTAQRSVELGPESNGRVVVVNGLQEGERILAPPAPVRLRTPQPSRPAQPAGPEAAGAPPPPPPSGAARSKGSGRSGGAKSGGGRSGGPR
jgi:hypothetical protein